MKNILLRLKQFFPKLSYPIQALNYYQNSFHTCEKQEPDHLQIIQEHLVINPATAEIIGKTPETSEKILNEIRKYSI